MTRHERQRQLNIQLSALPSFTPLNGYELHHINHSTPSLLLQDLIDMARKTMRYSIDTENDYRTHRPALIQIEFVRQRSIVLLVEVCHLPHPSSTLFWLMRSLFKVILQPANMILSWGDAIRELSEFVPCGLFSTTMVDQMRMIDVQGRFKGWYNNTFRHTCGVPSRDDHPSCTCSHRPVKNSSNPWSLQKAVACTFYQFLDKTRTKSNWSQRLDRGDVRSSSMFDRNANIIRAQMIQYATNDCLAVTKLFAVLEYEWTKRQLQEYNVECRQ